MAIIALIECDGVTSVFPDVWYEATRRTSKDKMTGSERLQIATDIYFKVFRSPIAFCSGPYFLLSLRLLNCPTDGLGVRIQQRLSQPIG